MCKQLPVYLLCQCKEKMSLEAVLVFTESNTVQYLIVFLHQLLKQISCSLAAYCFYYFFNCHFVLFFLLKVAASWFQGVNNGSFDLKDRMYTGYVRTHASG